MSVDVNLYRDAAARALSLELGPDSQTAVATHLAILFRLAQAFEEVELAPYDDPLPLYRP